MVQSSKTLVSRPIIFTLATVVVAAFLVDTVIVNIFPRFTVFQSQFQLSEINQEKDKLQIDSLLEELHITSLSQQNTNHVNDELQARIDILASEKAPETYEILQNIKQMYQSFLTDRQRNESVRLAVPSLDEKKLLWGDYLLNHQFTETKTDLEQTTNDLSISYAEYIASLPTPTPRPPVVTTPTTGYSYQTVTTSAGTFGVYVIKLPKSSYAVKTLAANTSDCVTDCPTNSLSDYVSQVGGYAGLNGTYFCPPDYASCVGRINSYDYPVFDSAKGTWLNEGAVTWNNIALATFTGTSDNFFAASSSYGGESIDAAISNFPMILINGEKAFDADDTTPYQETSKGARGVLGVDGQNYYLAIVTSATVPELVEITQKLGMVNAINLDGGGSSALYIAGQYIVGPGRSLPNAVVLVPK